MTTPRSSGTDSGKRRPASAADTARDTASDSIAQATLASKAAEAADLRAREVEAQMTHDERFSLIISVMGYVPGSFAGERDPKPGPDTGSE